MKPLSHLTKCLKRFNIFRFLQHFRPAWPLHMKRLVRKYPLQAGRKCPRGTIFSLKSQYVSDDALVYLILGLVGEGIAPQEIHYV